MVDANTDNTAQNMAGFEKNAESAGKALSFFNDISKEAAEGLNDLYGFLKNNSDEMQINKTVTEGAAASMALATNAFNTARVAFGNLASVDTGSLSLFSDQLRIIGVDINDANLPQFAKNMIISADNGLRLQNSFLQLSARTGNLSEVLQAAGPNLNNINLLLQQQQQRLNMSAQATGLSADAIERYYSELGAVPKALDQNVRGGQDMNATFDMLTATIQLQVGAGRDYASVIDDLKEAYRDYNITGEEALKFTARMTELAGKFGTEFDAVRSSIRDTSEMFKMFGNNAEGAAKMMNNYLGALQATGLSGNASLQIIKNMTHGMQNLSLAQKSFLSQQTGGPGGLMGAFQIEKMLRDGKMDEVMAKMEQSMKKQFGKIVSLDEASKSEQAANQLTKQVLMLRQGPLGSMVGSDQEAIRLIEAMGKKEKGKVKTTDLKANIVQDTMNVGNEIQKKSYTELSRMRSIMEAARGITNIETLNLAQESGTAGVGKLPKTLLGDTNAQMRHDLSQNLNQGGIRAGEVTKTINQEFKTKTLEDTMGSDLYQNGVDAIDGLEKVKDALMGPVNTAKRLFGVDEKTAKDQADKGFVSTAPEILAENNKAGNANNANNANIFGKVMLSKPANNDSIKKGMNEAMKKSPRMENGLPVAEGPAQAKLPVAKAISVTSDLSKAKDKQNQKLPEAKGPLPITGNINVHVDGYCLDCQQKIKGSSQLKSVSIPSGG